MARGDQSSKRKGGHRNYLRKKEGGQKQVGEKAYFRKEASSTIAKSNFHS